MFSAQLLLQRQGYSVTMYSRHRYDTMWAKDMPPKGAVLPKIARRFRQYVRQYVVALLS